MNIGIVIALEEELKIEDQNLKFKKEKVLNRNFWIFKYNGNKIILTYSGVGKVNASSATTILINCYKVNNIINIGSSGSVSKDVKVADIILVDKIYSSDVDLTFFGYEIGQMSNEPKFYKTSNEIISNKISDIKMKQGNASSADSFITKDNIKNFAIFKKYKISCIDMELSSIAQICHQNKVDLISIKIISDSIFEKKCNWEDEVKKMKERTFYILMRIVDAIIYK